MKSNSTSLINFTFFDSFKNFVDLKFQKTNTPNSILDVKQYIFCDSNGRLVLSDPRFVKQ